MTDNNAAREIRALYEGTLAESAARLAERTGLPLKEARALLAADPRVAELRDHYVLRAVAADVGAAAGVN